MDIEPRELVEQAGDAVRAGSGRLNAAVAGLAGLPIRPEAIVRLLY